MFIEYMSRETFMHRLDVRTKVIWFTGIIVMVFLFKNPLYNLGIALIVSLLAFSVKMPMGKLINMIKPLLPAFIFIIVLTTFTYTSENFQTEIGKRTLFYLLSGNRLGFSMGGFFTGLSLLIRIFIMVFASTLLTLTTPIDDFIQLLSKMKFPFEISLVITTGIRFIPTMEKKKNLILQAQKARGARLNTKGLIGQIKAYIPIMVPLIINSILMANNLSISMLNRGYGASKAWTNLKEIKYKTNDYCLISVAVVFTAVGIYLKYRFKLGNI